jgi:glutamate formiminotransferase/formiminotetrahydrofolate cyclodeaminase
MWYAAYSSTYEDGPLLRLVECVPNFSEGRDKSVIDAITAEFDRAQGVELVDVDPGEATNRTVVTVIGEPDAMVDAAFNAIKKAAELIDMRQHKGAHPRMGATDVCPFVPVSGITMEECAELAKRLGRRVGEELGIWVYLYDQAATKEEWRNLANVRQGEYESLKDRVGDPKWKPSFGPAELNERAGATAIGAREFLIAYNINLNTRDKSYASDIASNLREHGRVKREGDTHPFYIKGDIVFDKKGSKINIPGIFKHCRAVGWFIEEYGRAQISINLTNYKITPPHIVLEEARKQALERGLLVTGSEVVGLIPLEAMLMAGRYYLEKQLKSPGIPEEQIVATAIQSMGLRDVGPFDPDKKIIEYRFRNSGRLASLDQRDFANELSSDSPAPGGGSVAALAGALSAALAAMVSNLTFNKKGYEKYNEEMKQVGVKGQAIKDFLLQAIDRDTDAFNQVMAAMRAPEEEREEAIEEANKQATLVPLEVLRESLAALRIAKVAAEKGNRNTVSDAGVAGLMGRAGAEGAFYNVLINLKNIKDSGFVTLTRKQAEEYLSEATELAEQISTAVRKELGFSDKN